MRIIGIDPGMAITGYSILDMEKTASSESFDVVTSGSIQTDKNKAEANRLIEIHNDLCELIETYKPDVASVEKLFFFKNQKTIMPVSEARGVIVMTLAKYGIPVNEYTPLVIKQTITGFGRASKEEVRDMTQIMLNCTCMPKLDDAADAIAIALCHARQFECVCT